MAGVDPGAGIGLAGPADRARVVLVSDDGLPVGHWSREVASAHLLDGSTTTIAADDFVLLCPPGVDLLDGAEAAVGELLIHDPDVDLAYFDGIIDTVGGEPEACLRPGFSPDRLRDQHYLGPVLLIRGRLLAEHRAAGHRLDLRPDHQQVERLAGGAMTIAHLPRLLQRSSLADPPPSGCRRTAQDRRPLVSVIMPTMGAKRDVDGRRTTLCLHAIDRLIERTDHQPVEIVVVLTPGSPERLRARLLAVLDRHPVERRPTLRFCTDDRAFNFANACNRGAVAARGEVLVFLNDDTAVVTGDWLDRLVDLAIEPSIGAVGARLLYGDGAIQHAGIWSRGGHPAHRYEGFPADHRGHLDSLTVAQNCLAVTGACLAVEAAKFDRAGGFCPEFPSSYNDVDLCLKLAALGHRTVVEPGAVLTHHEASTRDPVIADWELELLHRRWRRDLIADPNDNPNHLAPGADEYPPPDVALTVERQRNERYRHPARVWRRSGPAADLIDLERIDRQHGGDQDGERHVV